MRTGEIRNLCAAHAFRAARSPNYTVPRRPTRTPFSSLYRGWSLSFFPPKNFKNSITAGNVYFFNYLGRAANPIDECEPRTTGSGSNGQSRWAERRRRRRGAQKLMTPPPLFLVAGSDPIPRPHLSASHGLPRTRSFGQPSRRAATRLQGGIQATRRGETLPPPRPPQPRFSPPPLSLFSRRIWRWECAKSRGVGNFVIAHEEEDARRAS